MLAFDNIDFKTGSSGRSDVHSAIIYDIKEAIVITDYENLYVLSIPDKKLSATYLRENNQNFNLIEEDYVYSLSMEDTENNNLGGLRIYFLSDIIKNKRCKSVTVNNFNVGQDACLLKSKSIDRIIYTRGLTNIEIIPQLH